MATLSLGLNNFATAGSAPDWRRALITEARQAEAAGVDRVIVPDHVVMGEHLDAYDGGRFPTGSDGDWLEPLTVLSVLAGATERIRLGTGILIAALRRPVVLAKAAATLDVLSDGRLDLGVGVGWQRAEYDAAGLVFAERGALLDESLQVCRALWSGEAVTHRSERLSFERTWCRPAPLQPGGVPIWISGRMHPRTLARIVEHGAGWIPWVADQAAVAEGVAQIRVALAAAGREPESCAVRHHLALRGEAGDLDVAATVAPVGSLLDSGVTDFHLVGAADLRAALPTALPDLVAAFREQVDAA